MEQVAFSKRPQSVLVLIVSRDSKIMSFLNPRSVGHSRSTTANKRSNKVSDDTASIHSLAKSAANNALDDHDIRKRKYIKWTLAFINLTLIVVIAVLANRNFIYKLFNKVLFYTHLIYRSIAISFI